MLDVALKLLNEITSHNYKAYIVGGFVRDHLMGIESNDVDITTNATPKQIKEIFEDSCLPNEDYGSVTVIKKGIRFEITTFRMESEYINNRKPSEIKYIDDLYQDLVRRDFIINTLCIDSEGNIIDYLGGREDINNKIIRTVGDASTKFNEDCLRILRAVRFATILDFNLSDDIVSAIKENKYLLKNLSYYRKKSELDKIFTSSNHKNGIKLLIDLGLDEDLELPNLSKILETDTTSLIGIWSLLNVTDKYPFNKNELDLIDNINKVLALNNLDPMALYNYGLYVNSVAGEIKGNNIKNITESYNSLVIKSRNEINITSSDIMNILDKGPGKYIKDIYENLEREILYRRLDNSYECLSQYIIDNFRI
jgi:tRNA nucleotidyltransferase (CCA-adding enzyme)